MNGEVDFENKDFWIRALKRMVAKRMLKRNRCYPKLLKNVTNLSPEEINNIIQLQDTFITKYDLEKRERYLYYLRENKYEDWECKMIVDLNEIDVYEICEGKGQSFHLDSENIAEADLINVGASIAKNLALIKMTDLGYSKADIEKVLGDDKIQQIYSNFMMIPEEVIDKMKNHFINIGINLKRYRILFNLLLLQNNIDHASKITGLSCEEIEKYIALNSRFRCEGESVLDISKVEHEMHLWNCELLIECIAVNGINDYNIKYYSKLSGIDEDYMKRICEIYHGMKADLEGLLEEMAFRLMDEKYDFNDIEEITGLEIYNRATVEYYFNKYKSCLYEEYLEEI